MDWSKVPGGVKTPRALIPGTVEVAEAVEDNFHHADRPSLCDEIGRLVALRLRRPSGRAGSSPARGNPPFFEVGG